MDVSDTPEHPYALLFESLRDALTDCGDVGVPNLSAPFEEHRPSEPFQAVDRQGCPIFGLGLRQDGAIKADPVGRQRRMERIAARKVGEQANIVSGSQMGRETLAVDAAGEKGSILFAE